MTPQPSRRQPAETRTTAVVKTLIPLAALVVALVIVWQLARPAVPPPGSPWPTSPEPLPAPWVSHGVAEVADGDTVRLWHNGRQVRCRLDGIDAPERDQPDGAASRDALQALLKNQTVTVSPRMRDQYGRLVVRLFLSDGRDVGQEQVRTGAAWWFDEKAPADASLARAQAQARVARVGLWALPEPEAPWTYRRRLRETRPDSAP